jgi:hypothetical protein
VVRLARWETHLLADEVPAASLDPLPLVPVLRRPPSQHMQRSSTAGIDAMFAADEQNRVRKQKKREVRQKYEINHAHSSDSDDCDEQSSHKHRNQHDRQTRSDPPSTICPWKQIPGEMRKGRIGQ